MAGWFVSLLVCFVLLVLFASLVLLVSVYLIVLLALCFVCFLGFVRLVDRVLACEFVHLFVCLFVRLCAFHCFLYYNICCSVMFEMFRPLARLLACLLHVCWSALPFARLTVAWCWCVFGCLLACLRVRCLFVCFGLLLSSVFVYACLAVWCGLVLLGLAWLGLAWLGWAWFGLLQLGCLLAVFVSLLAVSVFVCLLACVFACLCLFCLFACPLFDYVLVHLCLHLLLITQTYTY